MSPTGKGRGEISYHKGIMVHGSFVYMNINVIRSIVLLT